MSRLSALRQKSAELGVSHGLSGPRTFRSFFQREKIEQSHLDLFLQELEKTATPQIERVIGYRTFNQDDRKRVVAYTKQSLANSPVLQSVIVSFLLSWLIKKLVEHLVEWLIDEFLSGRSIRSQ